MNWISYLLSRVAATCPPAADDLMVIHQVDHVSKLRFGDMVSSLGAGKNLLIGGDFTTNPFQRGTASQAVTASGTYVADRWRVEFDGAPTITRDVVDLALGSKVLGATVRKGLKITVTAKGGASYIRLGQRIESVCTLAGDHAVLSSAIQGSKALVIPVRVVQCFGSGGAPSANVITAGSQGLGVTADMAELYCDVAVPGIIGKSLGTTANTNYLEVQYDLSSLATGDFIIIPLSQFERSVAPTLFDIRDAGEVAARCLRYFEKSYDITVAPGAGSNVGAFLSTIAIHDSTSFISAYVPYRVGKRVAPSVTVRDVSGAPANGYISLAPSSLGYISYPAAITSFTNGFYAGPTGLTGLTPGLTYECSFQYWADSEI